VLDPHDLLQFPLAQLHTRQVIQLLGASHKHDTDRMVVSDLGAKLEAMKC